MPILWLGKVDAPNEVYPNVSFNISWKDRFIIWPFKKYQVISRIYKNENLFLDLSYELSHWWFWGSFSHTIPGIDIEKETKFKIKVGYKD